MVKPVIEKFVTKDGSIRASAVVSTPVIQEMQITHNSLPIATAALGRAITGAALLASFAKKGTRLTLNFRGDGPLGQVFAEGDQDGAVRGFVANPHVHIQSLNGKLNVGGGVGKGFLNVATSLPSEKQPYTGSVEIQTGEIGEDIAYYLFQSQQTSSIVALGVFIEPDNTVSAAGGVIAQLMPGATEKVITILEERVKKMKSMTELVRQGATALDLAAEVLEDFEFRKLDQSTELKYACHCTRSRVEHALLLLGPEEIQTLIQKNEPTQVSCDFCGRKYSVDEKRLKELLTKAKK